MSQVEGNAKQWWKAVARETKCNGPRSLSKHSIIGLPNLCVKLILNTYTE